MARPLVYATLVLLVLAGVARNASARSLLDWDNCTDFEGFAALNNSKLSCAVAELEPPPATGLANFTLAWALALYSGPEILRLGLQLEDASWAAVAFPQYAYPGESPPLPNATALVFSRAAPSVAAADGPDAGGLTVTEYFVPGSSWANLQPSSKISFATVASGVAPDGGAYAVVEIPSYQQQVPSYGTHYPIRFMPALIAVGPSLEGSSGGSGGNTSISGGGGDGGGSASNSTGPWSSAPVAAGSLVIPYCCGDVDRLVWLDTPPSAAVARRHLSALATVAALLSLTILAFA